MTSKTTEVDVKHEKAATPASHGRESPLSSLRSQIDRLFDDFAWPEFRFPMIGGLTTVEPVRHLSDAWAKVPAMDLVERNGEYEVQAELPGLGIENVEVKLSDGMLTIKGEKSEEHSQEEEDYHLRERSYGSFQRAFRLPAGIDADKVSAQFDKGVLKVTLPKTAEAKEKERKIEVKAA